MIPVDPLPQEKLKLDWPSAARTLAPCWSAAMGNETHLKNPCTTKHPSFSRDLLPFSPLPCPLGVVPLAARLYNNHLASTSSGVGAGRIAATAPRSAHALKLTPCYFT